MGKENKLYHLSDPTFTADTKSTQTQKTVHKTVVILFLLFLRIIVWCVLWMPRASVYLNSVYYRLDVSHRVAIVDSHGIVVGHLQVAVKLLSSLCCCHIQSCRNYIYNT